MEIKNNLKYHFLFGFVLVFMNIFRKYVTMGHEMFVKQFNIFGVVLTTTYFITFFCVYSLNIKVISPKTLAKKNLIYFFLGQISLFFVFPAIRYFLEEVVVYSISGYHNYSDSTRTFWYYIFDNSYYSLKVILFSTFIYLLFAFLKNKNKIHQLELEQQKAELGALKTQLEPHFLFNTLNVFYSELAETQPKTAKGIYKLSELLRYLTYEAQKDYMPLQSEIKFVKDYMYFYEKRFEDNLFVDLKIEGEIGMQEIPSLMLIHFIENIFKHGIVNDQSFPAEIHIQSTENHLILKTRNKISLVKNYSSKGIGRENLKKRLSLLFDNNYIFDFNENDVEYSTHLQIPLKK
ncbi:histidine kinase [uncultured Tenacibaculum sp.]|uniref:sensor histidine kinase n=1 Tax=uncultured Tenacibaculum sp. TaxID=174713 RepID=UPI0026326F8D|nr:histidine kinase [uncultured Tenacibaculum sp.]